MTTGETGRLFLERFGILLIKRGMSFLPQISFVLVSSNPNTTASAAYLTFCHMLVLTLDP